MNRMLRGGLDTTPSQTNQGACLFPEDTSRCLYL